MGQPDDIRRSFNQVADVYDRIRPSYPAELFDHLFSMLPARPKIVEVGPGTGQATKDLLARGASVLGVELGPATAAKLRSNLTSDRLHISVGDFESIDIVGGGADAVFSATAYHWISRSAQTDRPASLLRPGGLVEFVDLIQVDSPEDAGFFAVSQPTCSTVRPGPHGAAGAASRSCLIPRFGLHSTRILVSIPLPSSAGTTGTRRTPLLHTGT